MKNSAKQYEIHAPANSETLFQENLSLVKIIAHHIKVRLPPDQNMDDLLQVGMIGLLEAARTYDPSLGAAFRSYASIRIRGAILDELRRQSWMPRSLQKKSRQLAEAIHKVENRLGRAASDREIADEMGLEIQDYEEMLESITGCTVFSLDDDSREEESEQSEPGPYESIQSADTHRLLTETIRQLPDQEKLVIALYYDNELNLREIGEVLDISESRVCQIHSQAVSRMRSRMRGWNS